MDARPCRVSNRMLRAAYALFFAAFFWAQQKKADKQIFDA